MAQGQLRSLVCYLRGAVANDNRDSLTDRELLDRFARNGDEAAFSVLVRRHGAFVLDVCRRILHGWHDAEDAMQGTFLVLARKAEAIAWRDSVAGWLHEVAVRVASEARRKLARRRAREQPTAALPETPCASGAAWSELGEILDQELRYLPDKYRAPLIMCCLEGRSRDEAAEQLGWSLGTVKGRLERGRELLRNRLVRRGVTLSTVLATVSLALCATQAALGGGLVNKTVRLAGAFYAGTAMETGAEMPVALARSILKGLFLQQVKAFAAGLIALVLLGTGGGVIVSRIAPVEPAPLSPALAQSVEPFDPKPPPLQPTEEKMLVAEAKHKDTVRSLMFSPDGKTLAAASWDKTIGLWDPATGQAQRPCPSLSQNSAVAFSPDGKKMFSGSSDGSVSFWDFKEAKETVRWAGAKGHIYAVAFSPDSKTVAAACQNSDVRLWDAVTGAPVWRFTGHVGRVWSVAFAPDSEVVASAAEDKTIRLWDLTLGRERRQLRGHEAPVHIAQFAPDGRTLLSGDADGRFLLWEAATGKVIAKFAAPGDTVQYLAISPDGTLAASAHRSGKIRLWSARTGAPCGEFPGHVGQGAAYGVCFSPDGKRLASSSEKGDVRVWSVAKGLKAEEGPAPPALAKDELPKLWQDLAADAPRAYKAIQRLSLDGTIAVPFLKERLKTLPLLDAKANREKPIARWIAELNDDEFTVRERAAEELKKAGWPALPALQGALKSSSAEVRRRAEEIIDAVLDSSPDGDTLLGLRSIIVLENIGDGPSKKIMETLAADAAHYLLRREAQAALKRLPRHDSH